MYAYLNMTPAKYYGSLAEAQSALNEARIEAAEMTYHATEGETYHVMVSKLSHERGKYIVVHEMGKDDHFSYSPVMHTL